MDILSACRVELSWAFLFSVCGVILIDIILAGDNAVVIAMASRTLPKEKRSKAIAFGAFFAVIMRVGLAFFASALLRFSYVKLVGGFLLLWIALKLLIEEEAEQDQDREANTVWHAVWIIIVADVSMSLDNVLALAALSKGNLFLLIFGLALSVPIIVCASSILARLMDRFPIIVFIGAAVLGKVAGELIITDPVVVALLNPDKTLEYAAQVFFAVAVVVIGRAIVVRRTAALGITDRTDVATDTIVKHGRTGLPER